MEQERSVLRPYVIGGAFGALALLGVFVFVSMIGGSPSEVSALQTRLNQMQQQLQERPAAMLAAPREEPAQPPEDEKKKRDAKPWGYVDALTYFAPPVVREVEFAPKHRLDACLAEFAKTALESQDGALFVEPGQSLGIASIMAGQRFHLHLITETEKNGRTEIARDDVVAAGVTGSIDLAVPASPPTRLVAVLPPLTIDYPDGRVLVPPYTVSVRLFPASRMQAILSAQEFVTAIQPAPGQPPDLWAAVSSRSDQEFAFGLYSTTDKRPHLTNRVYLCAAERWILQPTFRMTVSGPAGALSKLEILGYPPAVSYQAVGADYFDLEEDARPIARVAVPARPFISLPQAPHEPLPRVAVTATLHGISDRTNYRLAVASGRPRNGGLDVSVTVEEITSQKRAVTTVIESDRDTAGSVVPATAFYALRLAPVWKSTGGGTACAFAPMLRGPLHKHEPYVPTDKALHFKVVRLGGLAASVRAGSPWAPLLAGILMDGAVRSALGMPAYRPAGAEGVPPSQQTFDFKTWIVAGGGGLTTPGGDNAWRGGGGAIPTGGGGAGGGGSDFFVDSNGTVSLGTNWMGAWAQQQSNRVAGDPRGQTLPQFGWQSNWNVGHTRDGGLGPGGRK